MLIAPLVYLTAKNGAREVRGRKAPYLELSFPSIMVFSRVVSWLLVDEIEVFEIERL